MINPPGNDPVWIQVAETIGTLHAEILAGLLRSAAIPVYLDLHDSHNIFPSSAFGSLMGPVRVFVPEEYYEVALALLEEDDADFDPALEEPTHDDE